jgi:hypothetical protein
VDLPADRSSELGVPPQALSSSLDYAIGRTGSLTRVIDGRMVALKECLAELESSEIAP